MNQMDPPGTWKWCGNPHSHLQHVYERERPQHDRVFYQYNCGGVASIPPTVDNPQRRPCKPKVRPHSR